jgi:hypothetical protein
VLRKPGAATTGALSMQLVGEAEHVGDKHVEVCSVPGRQLGKKNNLLVRFGRLASPRPPSTCACLHSFSPSQIFVITIFLADQPGPIAPHRLGNTAQINHHVDPARNTKMGRPRAVIVPVDNFQHWCTRARNFVESG